LLPEAKSYWRKLQSLTWSGNCPPCRVQLKCDGTLWRTGGDVKGKLANGVCSQYSAHYLGTWCIQHYYRWCAQLGFQQSPELTSPADLNGLVRLAERRNLVSAHVPSHFKRTVLNYKLYSQWTAWIILINTRYIEIISLTSISVRRFHLRLYLSNSTPQINNYEFCTHTHKFMVGKQKNHPVYTVPRADDCTEREFLLVFPRCPSTLLFLYFDSDQLGKIDVFWRTSALLTSSSDSFSISHHKPLYFGSTEDTLQDKFSRDN
jgi:hypothetical protein